ncbi:MAG: hypothetical protein GVY24_08100 [Planctomycetes bacterium]|jgi:hypothetical protein|nr:hypothetical protein [Planctomycetota bacterium]
MAQNTTITCLAGQWTQLTDADIAAARVQNWGRFDIWLQATADATEPSGIDGSVVLAGGSILMSDVTLADLYPGVASPARLWVYAANTVEVSVSHA